MAYKTRYFTFSGGYITFDSWLEIIIVVMGYDLRAFD